MIVWYEQEHQASCVAACVRMALAGFGQYLDESEVRRLLGNPRFGLTMGTAASRLLAASVLVEHHADWGLDDLRDSVKAGDYPIVGVERRLFGYASAAHAVILLVVQQEVQFLDPLIGPAPQVYHLNTFEQAWKIAGKEALILQSRVP